MDLLKKSFRKSLSIISRLVGEEVIIVPTVGKKQDLKKIYAVSGSGVRIWSLLDGKRSLKVIRNILIKEFDVLPDKLEKDLVSIIGELVDKKFIEAI
ncbi:MAG: PqqD family protein [Candidatus Omnitrophota bacterium]